MKISRRTLVAATLGLPLGTFARSIDDQAEAPPLMELIRHPLLVDSLYRLAVSRDFTTDGAAGTNRQGYRWIEEQRQGVEWIVRGVATGHDDWTARGWRELDWGLAHQQRDGGFDSADAFHSTSFFVEALARGCVLDPPGATASRLKGLALGARWLMRRDIEARGAASNQPFTHRRYILAAAFGQAARATGDSDFSRKAIAWARQGLALQQPDGTNPERGGYDTGYQIVGTLMALRYLPVCSDSKLRAQLRTMIRSAVVPELTRIRADGSIDASGSTRIQHERARNGKVKEVPYGEILQTLVYGARAEPQPDWLDPARRIALYKKWLRPAPSVTLNKAKVAP